MFCIPAAQKVYPTLEAMKIRQASQDHPETMPQE